MAADDRLPTALPGSDVFLAVAALGIVFVMIVPIPSMILDGLVAINLGVSVVLLSLALYLTSPLTLSSFPSMLLLTTLFRLSLNLAATKLILHGEGGSEKAGHVIEAFGKFVAQDEYAVGFVVFLMITVIQFIVIAKGAERVAEVAARFSLDAMPGKQMSIDGDLRSGVIDAREAQARRDELERESKFYGAMDGAMKFVKGDAIAGLIIVAINIVGGIAIGTGRGADLTQVLRDYTLLTIGDGLVSQIPALLISTSAGLIVTKVSSSRSKLSSSEDMIAAFFREPRALFAASGFLLTLAIAFLVAQKSVNVPLLVLGVAVGIGGLMARSRPRPTEEANEAQSQPESQDRQAATINLPTPIRVLVGDSLARELASAVGTDAIAQVVEDVRTHLLLDLGLHIPGVQILSELPGLGERDYSVLVYEQPERAGTIPEGSVFAMASSTELALAKVEGRPAPHPLGGSGFWVPSASRDALAQLQLRVCAPTLYLALEIEAAVRGRAEDFVGVQEVDGLIKDLRPRYPALVDSLIGAKTYRIDEIADVLKRLLREGVSIRDLRTIFEALVRSVDYRRDPILLTESVRDALARQITRLLLGDSERIVAFVVSDGLVELLRPHCRDGRINLTPEHLNAVMAALDHALDSHGPPVPPPVVLVDHDIRAYVRALLADRHPHARVVAYSQVLRGTPVLGTPIRMAGEA